MKILVSGATGLIGRALCQSLTKQGHQIVVLSRQPDKARAVFGCEAFHWEPELEPPPDEVWEGVDGVVHLAGEPVNAARWTNEQKRRIRDSRVIGTHNLVEGIKRVSRRPQVLVSASAVGFYGDRGDEQLDERSPVGRGFLSEVCREWEGESARAQEVGVRVAQVRVGAVLSPAGGALKKILLPFKLGLGGRIGSGRQWFPWIHVDDIVGIFKHALSTPALKGPINGVAPGAVNNEEFTRELAATLNRSVFLPVPKLAMRIMIGEMADIVLASQHVIPRVALETGYKFDCQMLRPALKDLLGGELKVSA